MEEKDEMTARQRQLEKEIITLKDTIWRLTTRICVVESFLKTKYAAPMQPTTTTIFTTPIVQLSSVSNNSSNNITSNNGNQNVVTLNTSTANICMNQDKNDETTQVHHMEGNDDHHHEIIINNSELTSQEGQSIIVETPPQPTTSSSATHHTTIPDIASSIMNNKSRKVESIGDSIRIYKPELKTFVTVKADTLKNEQQHTTDKVIPKTSFDCHICGKTFSLKENVQRHILLHRAVQYKCPFPECGRNFSHQGNLRTHIKRHERVQEQHEAESTKTLLMKPQTDNDPARKHPCDTCGKKFYTAQQLTIHLRIHTGEKPYECDTCGMRFNQKASLQDHNLGHTGEKTNYCHLCPAGFVRSRNLLKHIRQVHKKVQIKTVVNGEKVVEFVSEDQAQAIIESRKDNKEIKTKISRPRVKRQKAPRTNDTTDINNSTATTKTEARPIRTTAGKRPRKFEEDYVEDDNNGSEKYIM